MFSTDLNTAPTTATTTANVVTTTLSTFLLSVNQIHTVPSAKFFYPLALACLISELSSCVASPYEKNIALYLSLKKTTTISVYIIFITNIIIIIFIIQTILTFKFFFLTF